VPPGAGSDLLDGLAEDDWAGAAAADGSAGVAGGGWDAIDDADVDDALAAEAAGLAAADAAEQGAAADPEASTPAAGARARKKRRLNDGQAAAADSGVGPVATAKRPPRPHGVATVRSVQELRARAAVLQRASPLMAQRPRAAALFRWAQQRALFRRVLTDGAPQLAPSTVAATPAGSPAAAAGAPASAAGSGGAGRR
jgi:hypothetical protein